MAAAEKIPSWRILFPFPHKPGDKRIIGVKTDKTHGQALGTFGIHKGKVILLGIHQDQRSVEEAKLAINETRDHFQKPLRTF